MKKFRWLILLLLLIVSPAWALFCQNCGKNIPEDAKFCPQCGKVRTTFQQEPVTITYPPAAPTPAPMQAPAPTASQVISEAFLAAYEPIDRFAMFLSTANYSRARSKAAEFRLEISRGLKVNDAQATQWSPTMTKLNYLYEKKRDLLDRYLVAMNSAENGTAKVQAQAQIDKLQFMLSKTDEMILLLKENRSGGSDSGLSKVADIEKDLEESTKEYLVTAPYLQVENHRVSRGQPIWVIETKDGMARVMHMGQGSWNSPVTGWVSVGNLEYRTGWRQKYRDGMFAPVIRYEPVVTTSEVIIVHDNDWHWSNRRCWGAWPHYESRHSHGSRHRH